MKGWQVFSGTCTYLLFKDILTSKSLFKTIIPSYMAGIGCVGSSINFTRSKTAWKKVNIQPRIKSVSREFLCEKSEVS